MKTCEEEVKEEVVEVKEREGTLCAQHEAVEKKRDAEYNELKSLILEIHTALLGTLGPPAVEGLIASVLRISGRVSRLEEVALTRSGIFDILKQLDGLAENQEAHATRITALEGVRNYVVKEMVNALTKLIPWLVGGALVALALHLAGKF